MKNLVFLISVLLAFSACNNSPATSKGFAENETASIAQASSTNSPIENSAQNDELIKETNIKSSLKDNKCFVKGVSNYKLYKPSNDEDNNGVTFNYKGRNLKVNMFDYQVGLFAQLIDEYGEKINLNYDDILAVVDENYDFDEYYKDWEYVITQYDIDSDGKDEIIIASRINDGMSTPVGIFIYRIKDGKSWSLKAPQTWGDMKIQLVNNHVKVEPNHFGFTYDWVFENDAFVDRGEY